MKHMTVVEFDEDLAGTFTVLVKHEDGQVFDLNAHGEPISRLPDLARFLSELACQGAFGHAKVSRLYAQMVEGEAAGEWI